MHTKFWLGNLKGRDHVTDIGVERKILLKLILEKLDRTGFIWLRTEIT
jgi:hypothetical protein